MSRAAARTCTHPFLLRPSPLRKPFSRPFSMTRIQATTATTSSTNGGGSSQPSAPRRIVSTYLSIGRPGRADFRVCLLRRLRAGHVYAGEWSVVAGSMQDGDAGPLAAALREVREETALREDQVEVLAEGDGFRTRDETLGVVWEIYPFLMRVVAVEKSGGGGSGNSGGGTAVEGGMDEEALARSMIVLDEEHDEVAFVTPRDMDRFDTVDELRETLTKLLENIKKSVRS